MKNRSSTALMLALIGLPLAMAIPAMADPTPVPLGSLITVDGTYGWPSVAREPDGSLLFAWGGSDGNIHAQRYSTAGIALSTETQVNDGHVGSSFAPQLAMDAQGNYVVLWQGDIGGTPAHEAVYAHRITAAGASLGTDFRIDTDAAGLDQIDSTALPSLAMANDGSFAVSWLSYDYSGQGGPEAVVLRRFAADGTPRDAAPIQVSSAYVKAVKVGDVGVRNDSPALAMNRSSGALEVTWVNSSFKLILVGPFNEYSASGATLSQLYGSDGTPTGSPATVVSSAKHTVSDDSFAVEPPPATAMDGAGNFVVSWVVNTKTAASLNGVYIRRFSSTAKALGLQRKVSADTEGSSPSATFEPPALAMDTAGNFVVAWIAGNPAVGPIDSYLIGQREAATGKPAGSAFAIAPATQYVHQTPSLQLSDDGQLVTAWGGETFSNDGTVLLFSGAYAQLFTLP